MGEIDFGGSVEDEENLWLAARERMRPYVSAVFWQDLGIGGEEHDRSVNWILDHIFRPEFLGATGRPVWRVIRQDDQGRHCEVARSLTRAAALAMIEEIKESGQTQSHWILPKP